MEIIITQAGLDAISNAKVGGFLIDVSRYRLTQSSPNLSINDSSLEGVSVTEGFFDSIEVVAPGTVKFIIFVPPKVPVSGEYWYKELGLYLTSGVLFAHGKLNNKKSGDFGLKLGVVLRQTHITSVLNLTLGRGSAGLPSASNLKDLIPPLKSSSNAVIVLDQSQNYVESDIHYTPSIAIRSGYNGSAWAYEGYTQVYRGLLDSISAGLFTVGVTNNGFWLNNGEVTILNVLSGPGAGESRKVRYNSTSRNFTILEKPITNLTLSSKVAIWRSNENSLPERDTSLGGNLVLGIGLNSFTQSSTAVTPSILQPYRLDLPYTGGSTTTLSETDTGEFAIQDNVNIYVNGVERVQGTYYLNGTTINWVGTLPPANSTLSVIALKRVTTDDGYLNIQEVIYDYPSSAYNLSSIPETDDCVAVFLDGKLLLKSGYVVEDTYVDIPNTLTGEVVQIIIFGNTRDTGISSSMKKYTWYVDALRNTFPVTEPLLSKNDTILTVNGLYLEKSKYEISSNSFVLDSSVPPGTRVQAWLSIPEESVIVHKSGENTGPVWVDPAGYKFTPNRLVLVKTEIDNLGGAPLLRISIPSIPDKSYSFVFVNGIYQHLNNYDYVPATSTLVLEGSLLIDAKIVILSFSEEITSGHQLHVDVISTQTVPDGSSIKTDYDVPGIHEAEQLLVFLSGVLQYSDTYIVSENTITLQNPYLAYTNLDIVIFKSSFRSGYYSSVHSYVGLIADGVNRFTSLDSVTDKFIRSEPPTPVAGVFGTFTFLGGIYQSPKYYSVQSDTFDDSLVFNNPVYGDSSLIGVEVVVRAVASGLSTTRLLLREEWSSSKESFMTVDNLSKCAFLPSGSTAERPTSPIPGTIRVNSDLNTVEVYIRGTWKDLTP